MSSLLEEQIKLEQSQRMRYQSELQLELARHRNAILEKQERAAASVATAAEVRRRGQELELAEEKIDESEVRRRRHAQLQVDNAAATSVPRSSTQEETGVRELSVQDDQESDSKQLKPTTATATTAKQAPYTTVAASIIDPRYRTMFGYRGPEHAKSTPAELAQMEQERLAHLAAIFTSSSSSSSLTPSVKGAVARISAENRVRLAMMDYTPSQIDSMTLEQASAVLHSAQHDNAFQEHHSQEQSLSKPTDTDANTCAQVSGGTRETTVAPGLVKDKCNKDEAIDEEEGMEGQQGDRMALQFTPDVMSSLSLKARGIHN
ncbi:hypothetical protein EC991_001353 [Linnemannia zychae]|nr:hypothetical protein EC991_001353 [Linnemannia zychae]